MGQNPHWCTAMGESLRTATSIPWHSKPLLKLLILATQSR
ncbi:MAG: hypothetical protein OFPI_42730 [Osedax symbiont Rs2]|nr:MAG: hypothetical protein OFPI_42730 [Osedax symbiont Rs2]